MDPFYYLDLELDENHTEDIDGLWDCYDCGLGGDWQIRCDSNIIKYKDRTYSKIEYNNNTKVLNFYYNDGIILTEMLHILPANAIVSVVGDDNDASGNVTPPQQPNIKDNIKELVDIIDDVKDNIDDGHYLKLMNLLGIMFNKF